MLRRTLTIFSLIGLLLSVGLWGASYSNIYYVDQYTGGGGPGRSKLVIACGAVTWPDLGPPPPSNWQKRSRWQVVGFHGFKTFFRPIYNSGFTYLRIPLWMPTALFATLSYMMYAHQLTRRRRLKIGLCVKCGYDLRASKERCPECGKKLESSGV